MNSKRITALTIACIIGVLGLPASVWGQTPGDATAVVVVSPISLTQIRPLSFGTFIPLGSAGEILVDANGTLSYTNVVVVAEGDRSYWDVSGIAGATYSLDYDATTILSNGTDTMDVFTIHHDGAVWDGTISNQGHDYFHLGAYLTVGANQPPGTYTGTFDVTVAYN